MKKLLAVDLDGTLLTTNKQVSEGNLQAIHELTEAGHYFAFATGRPVQSAITIARRYGFDRLSHFYIIAYNGALLYNCYGHKTIDTLPMKREDARMILDEAARQNVHCHTYDRHYVLSERDTEELRLYTQIIGIPPKLVKDASASEDAPPLKVICADLHDRSRLERLKQTLAPKTDGRLESVFSSDMLLEYSALGADKGYGILRLCRILGVSPENSVAAGDQENDLSMMEKTGFSFAMANAVDSVKAAASAVTEQDNDHDGIAEIIHKYLLS
ncbi:MAG: Cof-type HAD-IIB family hydrolase [Lachnospiraceae bacterium]|nr:Cof-type HAD-IIB family hydrolase [Lachnospiraceae bacterium]